MQSTAQSKRASLMFGVWFALTLVVLVIGFREAIFISPPDAEQGDIGRIFYWHVPSAMLGLVFPYINFAASLAFLYLRKRNPLGALKADAWAVAAAEVSVVFASICLATGMLWGKVEWGIWWTWDWRLTSMLVLWLLYVAYLMLRKLSSTGQTQTLAAVLSIFAGIDVPIVYMSIRWWRTQHPSPIFFSGDPESNLDKSMLPAFLWNLSAWAMWGVFILTMRYLLERRRQDNEQDAALKAIEDSLELTR
jgi:heme exporter protein C